MRSLKERIKGVAKIRRHPKAGVGGPRFLRKGSQIVAAQEVMKKLEIKNRDVRTELFKTIKEFDNQMQAQNKLQSLEGMNVAARGFRKRLVQALGEEKAVLFATEYVKIYPKMTMTVFEESLGER